MNKKFWIKFSVMLAIVTAILVLDLVTKYVLDAQLSFSESVTVIPYVINFKLVHNIGAAWGIFFLAIFIAYYCKEKNKTWFLNITFGFLIGGCIGNLFDRIFIGYVRDFIQFAFWQSFPVFNFADVALTLGVVMFIIYLILYFTRMKRAEKKLGINVENVKDDAKNFSKNLEENERTIKESKPKLQKKTKQKSEDDIKKVEQNSLTNIDEIEKNSQQNLSVKRQNSKEEIGHKPQQKVQKTAKNAAKMHKNQKKIERKDSNGNRKKINKNSNLQSDVRKGDTSGGEND